MSDKTSINPNEYGSIEELVRDLHRRMIRDGEIKVQEDREIDERFENINKKLDKVLIEFSEYKSIVKQEREMIRLAHEEKEKELEEKAKSTKRKLGIATVIGGFIVVLIKIIYEIIRWITHL